MHTTFQKVDTKLIAHRHIGTIIGPPYARGRYEVIDYVLIGDRWNNGISDIETDIYANIATDHYPQIIKARFKLKGVQHMKIKRDKYDICDEEQRDEMNKTVKTYMIGKANTYENLTEALDKANEENVPKIYMQAIMK